MQKHIFSMRKHKLTFSPVPASSMQKATLCPIEGVFWPPSAARGGGAHRQGDCRRLAAETKGGKGTVWFPCPLLSPPNPPLRRDALRLRGEMRGAHRDVWCSKGTPLIEAELFAAERGRPAPSGRALLCAANHASEIQGNSPTHELKNVRNRALSPV